MASPSQNEHLETSSLFAAIGEMALLRAQKIRVLKEIMQTKI